MDTYSHPPLETPRKSAPRRPASAEHPRNRPRPPEPVSDRRPRPQPPGGSVPSPPTQSRTSHLSSMYASRAPGTEFCMSRQYRAQGGGASGIEEQNETNQTTTTTRTVKHPSPVHPLAHLSADLLNSLKRPSRILPSAVNSTHPNRSASTSTLARSGQYRIPTRTPPASSSTGQPALTPAPNRPRAPSPPPRPAAQTATTYRPPPVNRSIPAPPAAQSANRVDTDSYPPRTPPENVKKPP